MNRLPSIKFGNEQINLLIDGTWQPSSDDVASLAKIATTMSRPPLYEYSPSHGSYGFKLAAGIVSRIGGELVLPELKGSEEPPEGVIF